MVDTKMLVVVVVVLILLWMPAGVNAQGGSIQIARHHMELGQEAFARAEFETAADEFTKAFIASPFAAFLYNAGLAYEKAGNAPKAVELYKQYLKASPDAADYVQVDMKIRMLQATDGDDVHKEVKITEVEMKSLISVRTNPKEATVRILNAEGRVVSDSGETTGRTVERGTYTVEASHPDFRTVETEIEATPGQVYIVVVEMSQGAFLGFLHVISDVPGALVYIDDPKEGAVGHTPFGNALPAGEHTLWIEKPGYEKIERKFEMALGQENRIEVAMKRLSFGTVIVKANVPSATVHVDGKPLGLAPIEAQLSPGHHNLRVTAENMKDYQARIQVNGGQQTKILVRMNPKPSRTSAWVSLGTAVALFTGGGIAGGQALKIDRKLERMRNDGRLANDDPRILKGFLWALGSDLSFGVGAIVGGLSIYYFLRDPLPPSEGKLFDPTDFEQNPKEEGSDLPVEEKEPETGFLRENRDPPKLSAAPILSPTLAGFGISLAF